MHPQKKRFDIIEHTSDIGIVAYGRTLKELFENAAIGTTSLFTDVNLPGDTVQKKVFVKAEDRESLLVNWLNEIIFRGLTGREAFNRFEISELTTSSLQANLVGKILPGSASVREIKAATYHGLKVSVSGGRYRARIIFDV